MMYDEDDFYFEFKDDADALIAGGMQAAEAWAKLRAQYLPQPAAGAGPAAGGQGAPGAATPAPAQPLAAQPQQGQPAGVAQAWLKAAEADDDIEALFDSVTSLPPDLAARVAAVQAARPQWDAVAPNPLKFPGLIGDAARYYYVYKSARRAPLPGFVGLLAGVATITGGAYAGLVYTRQDVTNLFLGLIGPTGGGKEDTRSMARAVVSAAEAVGARPNLTELASGVGLHTAFGGHTQVLLITDELGRKLEAVKSGADPHMLGAITRQMEMISNHKLGSRTYAKADDKKEAVEEAYLTTVEMTVEETFVAALPKGAIEDGYLNRQLLIQFAKADQAHRGPEHFAMPTLPPVIESAIGLIAKEAAARHAAILNGSKHLPPQTMVVADTNAQAVALAFSAWCEALHTADHRAAALWARAYMLAKRLAVIVAIGVAALDAVRSGRDAMPNHIVLTEDIMRLACQFVAYHTSRVVLLVEPSLDAGTFAEKRDAILAAVAKHADPQTKLAKWRDVSKSLMDGKKLFKDGKEVASEITSLNDMEVLDLYQKKGDEVKPVKYSSGLRGVLISVHSGA